MTKLLYFQAYILASSQIIWCRDLHLDYVALTANINTMTRTWWVENLEEKFSITRNFQVPDDWSRRALLRWHGCDRNLQADEDVD